MISARPTAASAAATAKTMMANDLPGDDRRRQVAPERHQVDVDGVQHQLDAHQDGDGVAPASTPYSPMQNKRRRQESDTRRAGSSLRSPSAGWSAGSPRPRPARSRRSAPPAARPRPLRTAGRSGPGRPASAPRSSTRKSAAACQAAAGPPATRPGSGPTAPASAPKMHEGDDRPPATTCGWSAGRCRPSPGG